MKPGLERLCEQYRTKAAQLSRDLLSAREAVSSGQDALQERQQENQALEATVGTWGRCKVPLGCLALRGVQWQTWKTVDLGCKISAPGVHGVGGNAETKAAISV